MTYYLYEKDTVLYFARTYSDSRLTGKYTERTTENEEIYKNYKDYKYESGQFVYYKPDSVVNEEKKNAHLDVYAQLLINDGYTGDLESITEIDAYFVQKYNDAQNDTERNAVVFLACRVNGYFAASMYRGNIKE